MAWRTRPLQLVLSGGPVTPIPTIERNENHRPYPHNKIQWEYNGLRGENRGPFKGQQASASNPAMYHISILQHVLMASLRVMTASVYRTTFAATTSITVRTNLMKSAAVRPNSLMIYVFQKNMQCILNICRFKKIHLIVFRKYGKVTFCFISMHSKLMGSWNPLLTHWSYVFLALTIDLVDTMNCDIMMTTGAKTSVARI